MDQIVVSVLLPMYNASHHIEEAVYSILNQTFTCFELIIIDDHSTDNSVKIVEQIKDERIILIKKEENSGYTKSLNYGLTLAKGIYIARMDADDISRLDRFEKQVSFLNENPDIILCGSNYQIIDTDKIVIHPTDPEKIKVNLLGGCYIAHPSIMLRKEVLEKNNIKYDPELEPAEDYNLWVRLSEFGKMGNLNETLLYYRQHENQVSRKKGPTQIANTNIARLKMIGYLFKDGIKNIDVLVHIALISGQYNYRVSKKSILNWIENIKIRNLQSNQFHHEYLCEFLEAKKKEYLLDFNLKRKNRVFKKFKRIIKELLG